MGLGGRGDLGRLPLFPFSLLGRGFSLQPRGVVRAVAAEANETLSRAVVAKLQLREWGRRRLSWLGCQPAPPAPGALFAALPLVWTTSAATRSREKGAEAGGPW